MTAAAVQPASGERYVTALFEDVSPAERSAAEVASDFLAKPFAVGELLAIIARHLG